MDEAQQSQMLGEFGNLFEHSCHTGSLEFAQWSWSQMNTGQRGQTLEKMRLTRHLNQVSVDVTFCPTINVTQYQANALSQSMNALLRQAHRLNLRNEFAACTEVCEVLDCYQDFVRDGSSNVVPFQELIRTKQKGILANHRGVLSVLEKILSLITLGLYKQSFFKTASVKCLNNCELSLQSMSVRSIG